MTDAIPTQNLQQTMQRLGNQAKVASRGLAKATGKQKSDALLAAAGALDASRAQILAANDIDLKNAVEKQLPDSMVDRLRLDDSRVDGIIAGIQSCLLYTSPSPRDLSTSRMPSSA